MARPVMARPDQVCDDLPGEGCALHAGEHSTNGIRTCSRRTVGILCTADSRRRGARIIPVLPGEYVSSNLVPGNR